jgi:flagellar basal-body rod protein FlgB
MYKGLTLFKTASALARHAGTRQEIVARNIANSETPGYRAQDLPAFGDTFRSGAAAPALKATRVGHYSSPMDGAAASARALTEGVDTAPDGNTVALETEMVRAADVRQQHEMALSVYRSGMELLRTSLGRAR